MVSPNITIDILITTFYTFLMVLIRRVHFSFSDSTTQGYNKEKLMLNTSGIVWISAAKQRLEIELILVVKDSTSISKLQTN